MASVLIQTQNVIDLLKACGLKRKEFQARCKRLMKNSIFCGYGDVQIILWCPIERQWELAPKLAEHFKVEMWMDNGKPRGPIYVYEGKPGLQLRDLEKER